MSQLGNTVLRPSISRPIQPAGRGGTRL